MNAIVFFIQSLLTSVFTALVIEFIRTGYGFTQGEFTWFDTFLSSWGIALGIHAIEFCVKAFNGSFADQDERPEPDFFIKDAANTAPKDYGSPLQ